MSTTKALLGRTAVIASLTALAIGALTPTSADARNGRWHGGGGAAVGAALAAGAIGTGLAIAASRDAYDYYDGPVYGGPAYYEAPSYYYGPAPHAYGYYRKGEYPYQIYGGESPNAVCAQGTTWNCR